MGRKRLSSDTRKYHLVILVILLAQQKPTDATNIKWVFRKICMTSYTGKMHYAVIGFVLSWIFHGAYDFGLSEGFLALGESAAILSVGLALLSLVLVIIMIVFFARKNKKQKYLEPLPQPANE